MKKTVITIPAYQPDARLIDLVGRLKNSFERFIVVDDGSTRSAEIFRRLAGVDGVTVLTHGRNRGKGVALKTAFAAILERYPDAPGTVTADADGQHLPEDVERVARRLSEDPSRLVLGVRSFGRGTPLRSRFGNFWSYVEFRLATGVALKDTQTGLRGIPLRLLPRLVAMRGVHYEYEIRMLADYAMNYGDPVQLPIATVYEKGNRSSHFRPLMDSIRTQAALFTTAFTAGSGCLSRASE